MGDTRGEGRSKSEKAHRLITPAKIRKLERERERQEEAEWAAKCGPVVTRRINDHKSD